MSMSQTDPDPPDTAATPLLDRVVVAISVIGGLIVLATAVLVTLSISGRWLFSTAIPGDFEFAQMGTALAIFAFLPVCQAHRGNIVIDTFTGFLSKRTCDILDGIWDLVYAGAAGFITYCMVLGTFETMRNGSTTMMLQLPTWPALFFSTVLIGVLTLVAAWTGFRLLRGRS